MPVESFKWSLFSSLYLKHIVNLASLTFLDTGKNPLLLIVFKLCYFLLEMAKLDCEDRKIGLLRENCINACVGDCLGLKNVLFLLWEKKKGM